MCMMGGMSPAGRGDEVAAQGDVAERGEAAAPAQPVRNTDADVRSGSVVLGTKPGILVDADDVAVRSGHVKIRAPWGPDVPVTLRVEVSGKVGSGRITARPPRRSLWQWLLRRPGRYAIASG